MIKDELCSRLEEAFNRNKELYKERIRFRGMDSSSSKEIKERIENGTLYFVDDYDNIDDYDNSPRENKIPIIVDEADGEINVRIISNFKNTVNSFSKSDEGTSFTIDKNPFNMKSAEFNGKACGVLVERPDGSKEMISVLRG